LATVEIVSSLSVLPESRVSAPRMRKGTVATPPMPSAQLVTV